MTTLPVSNHYTRFRPTHIARIRRAGFLIALLAPALASGQTYSVRQLAGTPNQHGYQDGPASAALFYNPSGVAVDSRGNVYVSDSSNKLIRKIAGGVVSTVAGGANNNALDTCDETSPTGALLNMRLFGPGEMALDSADNPYFDDIGCIFRMSNGTYTRLTTQYNPVPPGTNPNFNNYDSLAIDRSGNLYIADTENKRIYKYAGGQMAVFLNSGLNGPTGMAFDAAGNMYIADANRILKYSNGSLTTLAGTTTYGDVDGRVSASGFAAPVALAVDAAGNIYVAETFSTVRKISNGFVTTIARHSDGLGVLTGIAVDSQGTVYVSDWNHVIWQLVSSQGGGGGPAVTSLSPASATAGGSAFTLTVNGTNFGPGAAVQWNGTPLPTTYVSAGQLLASVSASLIASPGTVSITVASGGQTSAPVSFVITPSGGSSNVTVGTKVISNTTGIVNNSCVPPPPVTAFTTSSPQVWVYYEVSGASQGDSARTNFVRPDGVIYQSSTDAAPGPSACFSYAINISGAAAASYPGTWSVQAYWNNSSTPLFTLTFTLTPTGGGGVMVTSALPHFAAGGTWTTGIFLINTGTQPANFSISFYDDNGSPILVPVVNAFATSTLAGTIPAQGSAYYEAGNPQGQVVAGWGQITADKAIVVQSVFRNNSNGTYYEAGVPGSSGSREFLIPFDATTFAATGAPFYTGVAIANLDQSAAVVTCTARGTSGNVIANAVTPPALNPLGHWASYVFPALTGQRGTIDCVSNTNIAAIALSFIGSNAFSSMPVITK